MRSSAAIAAFAFFVSVSAQLNTYSIEARPVVVPGPPSTFIYTTLPGNPVFLNPIGGPSGLYVLGDGALYNSVFAALGIAATGPVIFELPNTASATTKYQNFIADNFGQLTFNNNNGITFYQCGFGPSFVLYVVAPGDGVPPACLASVQVNLFLRNLPPSPFSLPAPAVNSSVIVISASSNSTLVGLALAENPATMQINVNGNNPTTFFHDGVAQNIYDNSLRVWLTNGLVPGGLPVSYGVASPTTNDENFLYSPAGVVTYVDRGTSVPQSFWVCPSGSNLVLVSTTGTAGTSCFSVSLVAMNPALYVPPISSSSSSIAASTSSSVASSSSSIAASTSSSMASSSVASTSTLSSSAATSNTATGSGTVIPTISITPTGTDTATSTGSNIPATSTSSINSTPTPGTAEFIIIIDNSSNPALVGMSLSLSGSGAMGHIILTKGPGTSFQFINGFLRFLGGFFAIIPIASVNPFGSPVDYDVNNEPSYGWSQTWSSPLSHKRQAGSSLTFISPTGSPTFFYACQVGGATGNLFLLSSFSQTVPAGCSAVSLGALSNIALPTTPGTPSNSVTFTNDICVNVSGVQICTSGVFTSNGSGNLTASTNIDINLGTTFLVCALNSTNCQAVTQLPVTDLPCFAVTCTCSVCCSIMPVNAAASANAAAIAAAQSCGCLAGSALASAAASAQASATASGGGAASAAAAAANAGGPGAAAANAGGPGAAGASANANVGSASANAAANPNPGSAVAAAAGNAGSSSGSSASTKNSNAIFTGAAVSNILDFMSTLLIAGGTMMILA